VRSYVSDGRVGSIGVDCAYAEDTRYDARQVGFEDRT
jgi:hypothetical protein